MLIVIICACIVGGILWKTENRIKELQGKVQWIEDFGLDYAEKRNKETDERLILLAKDMLEMQTTVSNLVYRTNSNRLVKKLGIKPKSKKK